MPNISLADGFGLNLQGALDPDSAFAKYFKQLPTLSVVKHDIASLRVVSLAAFPLKSTEIGLTFSSPNAITVAGSQFTGSAAVSGSMCVITGGDLFATDVFDNPISVPDGHAYLGLGVQASASPAVSSSAGNAEFGFTAGLEVRFNHYKCFETTDSTPKVAAALQTSLQEFLIPFAVDDLAALKVGDVLTVEGNASLSLSGSFNLMAAVNPLASLSAPALPGGISVSAGAAINVAATFTVTGDFQIRIQRVDTATVRVGFYKKLGADFRVRATPSVGASAGTANVDFISTVLKAIGTDPVPPADQLEKAGLSIEKQEVIVGALRSAVQRRLELALEENFEAQASREAAFLYEIDLADLAPEGRSAIQNALRLNLIPLMNLQDSATRGIRELQSVVTTTKSKGHTLKINALGIYNYSSITDLTLQGTVLTDAVSGEILITDNATATRVSGTVNYLADPDKLRKVLAQSFLITAAYRCSGMIAHPPTLKMSYWHFAAHAKTDRSTMADYLNAFVALGLISPVQKTQRLGGVNDFGRSSCYLNTDYDDAVSQSLYLHTDGQPRKIDEFERIGRNALRQLLHPGDDDFRLRDLENDKLWQQVKETGGTLANLAPLFPDLRQDWQIPLIAGDYTLIAWWATTMSKMAEALSTAKRFFSQKPAPSPNSPESKKVQADLWSRIAQVASNTHDRFSDPWGIIAIDLASGQHAKASARIVSPPLTLNLERSN